VGVEINKDAESTIQRENINITERQKDCFSLETTGHNNEMKVSQGEFKFVI
jgi:hypothetical protein